MVILAMKKIPVFLKCYFWDIDFKKMDRIKYKTFILRRILEYGDEKSVRWMFKHFNRDEIAKVLAFSRIDPRSANFWSVVLGIKKDKILCLQKHYLEMRKKIWPY